MTPTFHSPSNTKIPIQSLSIPEILLRTLLHISILGLSIISLAILWSRAPRAAFAVFLAWTVSFYVLTLILAWRNSPPNSILSILFTRLRPEVPTETSPTAGPVQSPAQDDPVPFPTQGPYLHQPPYRTAYTVDDGSTHGNAEPRAVDPDDDDDEEDEHASQTRIEEEMGRRDVSIVTSVPKRKLWITNPS